MKTPRFFLGAVVLFWGWQVQTLLLSIIIAVILESARAMTFKFELKPLDFNKFVDISTVFLAGTVVIALTIEPEKAILIILKWLPVIFFPIIASQEFSKTCKIDTRSFFLVSRKRKNTNRFKQINEVDVSYIYSFLCILSAGMANTKTDIFFIVICLLFLVALWQVRSKRGTTFFWTLCIMAALVAGYAGQKGIHHASRKFTRMIMAYYANYYNTNPFKNSSAIGEVGRLKLSGKIVLRVKINDYIPNKSYLLHNSTYSSYASSHWFARSKFEPIVPQQDDTFWQINPDEENTRKMILYSRLRKQRAILALPSGVISIAGMKAGVCEKNPFQSVRIEDGPSLIKSVISYIDNRSYDASPADNDFFIHKKELPAVEKIVNQLELHDKSTKEVLNIIKKYFLSQYTYSLDLKGKGEFATPLQNFLNYTKSGHCEFFATATTLILRQAKIPARYATGFIAHEYSRLENQLIVRHRDAHAWVKVYVNGQWQNFDTTPPSFLQVDSQIIQTSIIMDLFSFLGFKLSQLRHETGAKLFDRYGLWLILPLGILLFFRLRTSNKIKVVKVSKTALEDKENKKNKTCFYLIENFLSKKGYPKYPYETYSAWIKRINHLFYDLNIMDDLQNLLMSHNRLSFSESGLKQKEKIKLDSDIKTIIGKISIIR